MTWEIAGWLGAACLVAIAIGAAMYWFNPGRGQ